MKNFKLSLFIILVVISFACSIKKDNTGTDSYKYKPDDQNLYDTIVYLDSVFFQAYNTCTINLEKYGSFYSDSLEFYHDKGGVMNSRQDVIDATQKNICGKVTRELVKGSVEVYPIANYGAVEIGLHKFHNKEEKEPGPAKVSKFILMWQHKNNEWKITQVISLH